MHKEAPIKTKILPRNFFGAKFIKDGEEKIEAGFVMSRHRDKFKNLLAYNSTKLQARFIKLLLDLAHAHNLPFCTIDVTQDYVQSTNIF